VPVCVHIHYRQKAALHSDPSRHLPFPQCVPRAASRERYIGSPRGYLKKGMGDWSALRAAYTVRVRATSTSSY